VPELRSGCDLLICLSHIGLAKDRELAARRPEIDLIIGGHTHAVIEQGERVGETLIVQAGWWGKLLGTVDVQSGSGRPQMTATVEPL
jgi:5'-nucleotidase